MKSHFAGSRLFLSARSPFARRVRVAFLEAGVPFESRVVDLFGDVERDAPDLLKVNPLGRVPVLEMVGSKTAVSESHEILKLFHFTAEGSKLLPADFEARAVDARLSGLSVGISDLVVAGVLEKTRPQDKQSADALAEWADNISRTLRALEKDAFVKQSIEVNAPIFQGAIDLGCTLSYLRLRWGASALESYPLLSSWLEFIEARKSFKDTAPPAV